MKSLFQKSLELISNIFKSNEKKKYSDVILINEEGKILLLLRSMSDDFCPGQWALPGGSIEKNEHPSIAALRELKEETDISLEIDDLQFYKEIDRDSSVSYYFIASVDSNYLNIVLDNYEHQGYEWVSPEEIKTKDCLMDLGGFLLDSFDVKVNHRLVVLDDLKTFDDKVTDAISILSKSLDNGLISDSEFLDKIRKLDIIKSNYDSSVVEKEYEGIHFKIKKKENIKKAEDIDDNLSAELASVYKNYVDKCYLYNDKLYDINGFGIPMEQSKVKSIAEASPNIYIVDCTKLDAYQSNKPILEDIDRYDFNEVLPTIKKYNDYYNKFENELREDFSSSQNDFKQRRSEIKKTLKEYFQYYSNKDNIDKVSNALRFIKSQLKEDVDPLLIIKTSQAYNSKRKQIFLSELEDYISKLEPKSSFRVYDIEVSGIDGYADGEFKIEYFDDKSLQNILSIHERVKDKMKFVAKKDELDDKLNKGNISDDEYLHFFLKSENSESKELSDKELVEHAKNTSLMDLERIIKESPDPKLREKAHEEIKRREEEEHVKDKEENKKNIKKAEDLNIQKAEETLKGCLMFYPKVNKDKWKQKIESIIPQEIVQEYELDPHITILYGFDDLQIDINRLEQIVNEYIERNPIEIKLQPISLFRLDDKDVVKIGISDVNGNLIALNRHIRNNFKYENDFPEYVPHITLAYVNKGEGEKLNGNYADLDDFGFLTLNTGDYIYSNSNKQKFTIRPYISGELAWNKSKDNGLIDFYQNDIEKAKANIGEIRNWGGFNYKKIADGEWVKLTQTKSGLKEKVVAQSSMKKVIQSEMQSNYSNYESLEKEFEDEWKKQNGNELHKIQLRVKLSRDKSNDPKLKEAYEKYQAVYRDLNDDLIEVQNLNELKAKKKREEESGKKEVSPEDEYFKSNFDFFHKIFDDVQKIESYVSASEALGTNVTTDNYWLNTDTFFKTVYQYDSSEANDGDTWIDPVERKWEEMKKSGKYEFTQSPKSTSQYLVDKETGDIYRKADHWGRCASCWWDSDMSYGIGVSNVKDFKRNDRNSWSNPKKTAAIIAGSKTILKKLKEMITNDDIYFDKNASERIKNITKKIESELRFSARVEEEEMQQIQKEYKEVFEFDIKKSDTDENDIEKAKAFPIGSLDKSGKNVKTADGWKPVKTHGHLVEKEESKEIKGIELQDAKSGVPSGTINYVDHFANIKIGDDKWVKLDDFIDSWGGKIPSKIKSKLKLHDGLKSKVPNIVFDTLKSIIDKKDDSNGEEKQDKNKKSSTENKAKKLVDEFKSFENEKDEINFFETRFNEFDAETFEDFCDSLGYISISSFKKYFFRESLSLDNHSSNISNDIERFGLSIEESFQKSFKPNKKEHADYSKCKVTQMRFINAYTRSAYRLVNRYKAGSYSDVELSQGLKKYIDLFAEIIDRGLNNIVNNDELDVVFRTLDFRSNAAEKTKKKLVDYMMNIGNNINYGTIVSTSISQYSAFMPDDEMGHITYKIDNPKSAKLIQDISNIPSEQEAIFPTNAKFEITGVRVSKDRVNPFGITANNFVYLKEID